MDCPTPMIRKVVAPEYRRVTIETSDGKRYRTNLSSFADVACFPADEHEWRRVSIDSYGLALVWACRFEVHADQVIALADSVELVGEAAA